MIFFIITLFTQLYVRFLAFNSHVENILMTASFHLEGRFGSIKLVLPHHFLKCRYQGGKMSDCVFVC